LLRINNNTLLTQDQHIPQTVCILAILNVHFNPITRAIQDHEPFGLSEITQSRPSREFDDGRLNHRFDLDSQSDDRPLKFLTAH
jgi:hypothetical protein